MVCVMAIVVCIELETSEKRSHTWSCYVKKSRIYACSWLPPNVLCPNRSLEPSDHQVAMPIITPCESVQEQKEINTVSSGKSWFL
jgi:hypothetical protein